MTFSIGEAFLPAKLTAPPMTDEEFEALCSEHPDLLFEVTAEGELIVMPPANPVTGGRRRKVATQLGNWSDARTDGYVTDAATGFVLPNGARRAPDAAWTQMARIRAMDPAQLEGAWHLCPDFVIEIRSGSDRIRTLREKMQEWIDNGAQLAWLLDPETRTVEIYRPNANVQILTDAATVAGEGPIAGFVLDLAPVWNPLGQ